MDITSCNKIASENSKLDNEDRILKTIFQSQTPDNCIIENAQVMRYLSELGSCNVEQIFEGVKSLEGDRKLNIDQMKQLVREHYKTFVELGNTFDGISDKLQLVKSDLQSFSDSVPELLRESSSLANECSNFCAKKRKYKLILERIPEVSRLLDIPKLMNACIYRSLYEEAFSLATYARKMNEKHEDIPIIGCIKKRVDELWQNLIIQLLSNLRTELSVSQCLEIVAYLRKMNAFDDASLRLTFLQQRNAWFDAEISKAHDDDRSNHLKMTTEFYRKNVFVITSQFLATFPEEINPSGHVISDCAINLWIVKKVDDFLNILATDLPHCPAHSLGAHYKSTMNLTQSVAKIGIDFASSVTNLFVSDAERRVKSLTRKATKKFENSLARYVIPKVETLPDANAFRIQSKGAPPSSLLIFPPMAIFCNDLLISLNEIRCCPLMALCVTVTNSIQDSLKRASRSLLKLYKQDGRIMSKSELESLVAMCDCFDNRVIPHLQQCVHTLFPPNKIATLLGVTMAKLDDEGIGYFRVAEIVEPIQNLLSIKPYVPEQV